MSRPTYKPGAVPLRDVFKEFPDTRMIIEMKRARKSPAAALGALIVNSGMKDKVLVGSFVGKFMNEFRAFKNVVATSYTLSLKDVGRLISGKKFSYEDPLNPSVIRVPYQLVTDEVVRKSHQRNIKVQAWTVNDLDKMYLMWNRRVDGIITDYPGPLMALLGRAGTV